MKKSLSLPHVSIFIACSIDGFIARPDGNIDWLQDNAEEGEDCGFASFSKEIDTIIMGRGTYDVVSNFPEWPYKGKKVIVLSNSLKSVNAESELYTGELLTLLQDLGKDDTKRIWIDGGQVASQFLDAGLVDEMIITIISIVLGSGIPLFSQIKNEHKCKLISSKSFPNGLAQLKYKLS